MLKGHTAVTMRRTLQFIIPALIILTLVAPSSLVTGQPVLVGVHIPAETIGDLQRTLSSGEVVIDYGSFTWMVLTPADLAGLDAAGIPYQASPSPYNLTLGGETFDPLHAPPNFPPEIMTPRDSGRPGLHLVQFKGPTKSAWLDSLQANGLEIVQYIHPFTYMVWGDGDAIADQSRQGFIRWSGDYLPVYAVQPQFRSLAIDPVQVRILVVRQAGLEETRQVIVSLGGEILSTSTNLDPSFDTITAILPGNLIPAVAAIPGVYTVQPVPTDGGNRGEMSSQVVAGNIDSSNRAFTGYISWLNALGLSGEGIALAIVDDGVNRTHPDLVNRMLPCIGTTCGDDVARWHGTHVAGIIVGDGSSGIIDGFGFLRGLGMAPGANLVEQLYSPTYTESGGMLTLMTESFNNEAVISNNSWGPSGTPLGYDADTRWVDIGVRDADPDTPGEQPMTYVLSIMNGYGGTSSQGTPDEAKNIISVGSTMMQNSNGSQNLNIDNLSVNTAHGPALDGRHLPHLVAPGCYVDSTSTPGSGHTLRCGASMASPHVSGTAALFFEMYRNQFGVDPSPALVKAALLPVAHSLADNLDADGLPLGHPFDSKQGWGRLNASAILNFPGKVTYFDQEEIFTKTGQTWEMEIIASTPFESLRVMLVWTDAPGHGLGGETPAWVNDLDLSIQIDGQTYYGNNFGEDGLSIPGGAPDSINNTEGIFLGPLPEGTYTLTVTAANISGKAIPSHDAIANQDFALVVYSQFDQPEQPQYQYNFPLFFR